MGNCCRHESSMTWAGDDWDCFESETRVSNKENRQQNKKFDEKVMKKKTEEIININEEFKMMNENCSNHHKNIISSSSSSSTDQIKIRITKKELEELLGKIDVQGLSIEQILTQILMNSSNNDLQYHAQHHQSWRPALQSIPEVN